MRLWVPPGCELDVAGQRRLPQPFEPLLFDDTYLHHAANPGTRARVHLLVDVFHPGLEPAEVRALRAVLPLLTRIRLALA